jgi:hypothetical protein
VWEIEKLRQDALATHPEPESREQAQKQEGAVNI